MSKYRLSKFAKNDLAGIRNYTRERYGVEQCKRYLHALTACFRTIAENPNLGRSCDYLAPGLIRIEEGKHVVFFTEKPYGVRIVRVLHERMMPGRHDLIGGEEE